MRDLTNYHPIFPCFTSNQPFIRDHYQTIKWMEMNDGNFLKGAGQKGQKPVNLLKLSKHLIIELAQGNSY